MLNYYVNDDIDDMEDIDEIINIIPRLRLRMVYERADHFHNFTENQFFERFRLRKNTVLQVLQLIENRLEYPHNKNNSVSPMNQLLVTLRVYATGGHLLALGDFGGMSKATVSRIVLRVSEAIAALRPIYIKFPQTEEEIAKEQQDFYDLYSFPRVVGAIDGTHIRIQSPGNNDGEIYRNRKSYFSINVQVICNVQKKITNIVARWPGSAHDMTIFNNSTIRARFENGDFPNCLLLGDSGYQLKSYLLTPFLNPDTRAKQLYNESHIRTRTIVENLFGIWKRRFPIAAYGSRLKVETTLTVIIATAVLYNIARDMNEPEPILDPEQNEHDLQRLINDGQIPEIPHYDVRNNAAVGIDVRNDLVENYFSRL